jgi:diadenosine tetraphosphate (Ap4A) HIT family hydrolase
MNRMKTTEFKINKQLLKDSHLLFIQSDFYVLLHKNASIPWIILVPKTSKIEVYELPQEMQNTLNLLTIKISRYFKDKFATKKMNIAAIGNIVSQLHIHVIGRNQSDACWPDVVWGNEYTFIDYSEKQIDDLISFLKK